MSGYLSGKNALIKWGTNGCVLGGVQPSQITHLCQRTGNCALTCWWNNSGQVTVRPAGKGNERRNEYGLLFTKHFKTNEILCLAKWNGRCNSVKNVYDNAFIAVMLLLLKMTMLSHKNAALRCLLCHCVCLCFSPLQWISHQGRSEHTSVRNLAL